MGFRYHTITKQLKIMNEESRTIFNKLLEVNFKLTVAQKEVRTLHVEYTILDDRLRDSMGAVAYNKFMANGKAMFAPKS